MRMALWIASPPTCSVRTPRASLTAMDEVGFLPDKGNDAAGCEKGERGGGEDRQVIGTERIEGHAREPGAEQRADAGAGIEGADDSRDRKRDIEIHYDRGDQRHIRAEAHAKKQRENGEKPPCRGQP